MDYNGTGTGGSPDDIVFDSNSALKRYGFFKGYGDVGGHTYEFTFQAEGTITLKEYDSYPPFRSASERSKVQLSRARAVR